MNLKFVPNLFLEVAELERFKQSLDEKGFRKNIIENSESFGLIQNKKSDPLFLNGKVTRDFDTTGGDKTIKISPLYAIDKNGQFIYQEQKNAIVIPNDSSWYWIRQSHTYSSIEVGTFSISVNGDLVGSIDSKLTEVLRGQPNFPARIRFTNSEFNILEYDVLELIDDQNAILQHPALASGGSSAFVAETDLKIEVIGTFTPGIAILSLDKKPFQYDSATLTIVPEIINNTRPPYTEDTQFYIARVKVVGADLIVQDKRIEYWRTKGSQQCVDIDRVANPVIGVETIKWDSLMTPSESNILEIAWGMRSQNWSIDSSQNIVTLQGSALGGKFKSIAEFVNGDFDGWRVYTDNGKYCRVLSSTTQGLAINLVVDMLDVDNYSFDGGITFTATSWVLVVPDTDTVIISCIPDVVDVQEFMKKEFEFPVNTLLARIRLVCYKDPVCDYTIQYRYQSFKEFTKFRNIPKDLTGYYTEISFDNEGNFKPVVDRVLYPYDSGFIRLNISLYAYSRIIAFINKGDLIGVNTVTELVSSTNSVRVGITKNYQHIVGDIVLATDIFFTLSDIQAISGNEFRFHFECNSLDLAGKNIYFQKVVDTTVTTLKKIEQGDIYHMLNQEGGIVLDFVFDELGSWIMYQNYDLGAPGQIKTLDGVIDDLFEDSLGKVRGLFGHALCDGVVSGVPNLVDRFIVGAGDVYDVGDSGGAAEVTLTAEQVANHTHGYKDGFLPQRNDGSVNINYADGFEPFGTTEDGAAGDGNNTGIYYQNRTTATNTGGQPHNNLPPYYALIYAKKLY